MKVLKKILFPSLCCLAVFKANAQFTVTNDGMALVSIESGLTVSILGGYTTKDNVISAANGKIDNQGTLQLTGDWTNNNSLALPNPFSTNAGLVVFNGTALQNIFAGTNPTTFYDLTIANTGGAAAGVLLGTNTTASNLLMLTSGPVTTGVNTLIHSSTTAANLTYGLPATLSFVFGNLRRYIAPPVNASTYFFPISNGTAATDRHLFSYVNASLNGVTYLDASVADFVQAGANVDANLVATQELTPIEFTVGEAAGQTVLWTLTPDAAPTGGSYAMRLYVENTTLTVAEDDMFCPIQRSDLTNYDKFLSNDGTTTIPTEGAAGRIYSAGAGYAERAGITFFPAGHQFGIGLGVVPLPVELLSFDAKPNGSIVDITWTTASELNNDYFLVEKSRDGISFDEVVQVQGAGNSSTLLLYQEKDYEPYNGISYYRLKQVDFNGEYAYSNLVAVNFHGGSMIEVYPSIVSKDEPLNVSFSGNRETKALIVVRDLQGKEFYSKIVLVASDKEVFAIDTQGKLAAGIYFVVASSDDTIYKKKIVVK